MSKIPKLRPVFSADEIQPQKRVAELVRVPADRSINAIVLCECLYEMPTHFDGQRTVLCSGEGHCEHCAHRAMRMYYLIASLDITTNTIVWVQLSQLAGESLLRQARQLERPLYGLKVTIGRVRKKKEAPITVDIDLYATVSDRLPKPMEPSETLERVFNSPKLARQKRNSVI